MLHLVFERAVIFINTSFQKELRSSFKVDSQGGEGGTVTEYSASVSVRGVNVQTSEVAWSGTARYPKPISGIEDALTRLTCQALATAWGLRPPGQDKFDSQAMCTIRESIVH